MAIQNRETTLPGIWAENAQTDIPTPPVAGVTYRDTTLNSTAIDKAWPFKTIVDSSDFNQHAFLQDTLIKESEQYGIMRWNNTTSYKKGGFCLGQDGKLYQALRDNQGKEPTSSTDDWKVFTSGGGFSIGSIGYTLRTEVPEGGAWCDGAEYTKEAFPDIYQMLVDGKLQKTDYETFNSSVSANGSCGFFALDSSAQKFKVPMLKDVYLKAGQAPLAFGAETLPNISGEFRGTNAWNSNAPVIQTGALYSKGDLNRVNGSQQSGYNTYSLNLDASRSSSTYQDGAKVNPDHVTYRAYVVLYASVVEASVAQAQEFMTVLRGKANVALDNVSPAQSFKDMSIGWGMPDYTAGVTCTAGTLYTLDFPVVVVVDIDSSTSLQIYKDDVLIKTFAVQGQWPIRVPFLIPKGYSFKPNIKAAEYFPLQGVN